MHYINSLSLVSEKKLYQLILNKQFESINIKTGMMNTNIEHDKNAYALTSQERHTFMTINTIVKELLQHNW